MQDILQKLSKECWVKTIFFCKISFAKTKLFGYKENFGPKIAWVNKAQGLKYLAPNFLDQKLSVEKISSPEKLLKGKYCTRKELT